MGNFGEVAVRATRLLISVEVSEPRQAWLPAAKAVFSKPSMIAKACPRNAYLRLCQDGLAQHLLSSMRAEH
jgi:hypothetical protein